MPEPTAAQAADQAVNLMPALVAGGFALGGVIVAQGFAILIKRLEYRNTSFKEIAQKRIDAHDELEVCIKQLFPFDIDDKKQRFHPTLVNPVSFKSFMAEFQGLGVHKKWYHQDILDQLEMLKGVFEDLWLLHIGENSRKTVKERAIINYLPIQSSIETIRNDLFTHIFDMHEIKRLMRERGVIGPPLSEVIRYYLFTDTRRIRQDRLKKKVLKELMHSVLTTVTEEARHQVANRPPGKQHDEKSSEQADK